MPLVHACSAPGCSTITMGRYCIEHEARPAGSIEEPRPRRFAVAALAAAFAGLAAAALTLARARVSV